MRPKIWCDGESWKFLRTKQDLIMTAIKSVTALIVAEIEDLHIEGIFFAWKKLPDLFINNNGHATTRDEGLHPCYQF